MTLCYMKTYWRHLRRDGTLGKYFNAFTNLHTHRNIAVKPDIMILVLRFCFFLFCSVTKDRPEIACVFLFLFVLQQPEVNVLNYLHMI